MHSKESTITAIATPLGEGGVAIVRLSGKNAFAIADSIFSKNVLSFHSHTAHLGYVIDKTGAKIDQALCLVMKGPASYTGEDVVELQCHGGTICVRKVLEAALEAGATLATAGEFTYRAFINGKIDLAQAESVQALIGAKSEEAFLQAKEHLEGRLSHKVTAFQKELIEIAAILEAWVDFPEEDLAFTTFAMLIDRLRLFQSEIKALLHTYDEGKRLAQGPKIALVGAPNVGKSSLMNALLDSSRAIVSAVAGTTRDTIEADFILQGRSLVLVDTAGLRTTHCEIENLGIARSKEVIEEADLIIWVVDATKSSEEPLSMIPEDKRLIVANKSDLATHPLLSSVDVVVSAKTKIGLDDLKRKIDAKLASVYSGSRDALIISSHRHYQALIETKESIERVIEGLESGVSAEFITFDIKSALHALGKMIGQDVTEEILTSIFSQFCIGK